jgi:hypothetical protein
VLGYVAETVGTYRHRETENRRIFCNDRVIHARMNYSKNLSFLFGSLGLEPKAFH